ncbi:prolyl oligopeptidase family serine peptidase [Synechococcus sp. CBW1107]|uniref:S9 family peptidase n=2 Tax=unclassified Synechococcus TaxID=2626047 RepID=UPI002AD48D35|nr:prolyl oligopeptidase family serine peptidase [Synechococcus sp. CBW1107]CAK6690295.1 hypothetical protein IFHNHDMJ_00785 [Synechococcus sp. CBW1107]
MASQGKTERPRPKPLPLTADQVVGRTPVVKEPRLDQGRLFWLEQRPHEGGRTTLLLQLPPSSQADPAPGRVLELTPGDWNLRSRVHDYGGGCYAVQGDTVVMVADADRALWRLDLADLTAGLTAALPAGLTAELGTDLEPGLSAECPEAASVDSPLPLLLPAQRLTAADPQRCFADGLIDAARQRWIGVMEAAGRDHLVSVPLQGGEPTVLLEPDDFCGYAALSPDGRQLAWVEWQQPFMPWQRSQVWLGRFAADGSLQQRQPVAGAGAAATHHCSVFQPLWIGNGDLVVANDRSGWWNLERLSAERIATLWLKGTTAGALNPATEPSSHERPDLGWEPLLPLQAEFAMPQWVYGMRTTAWDGEQLVAAACRDGRWQLGVVPLDLTDRQQAGAPAQPADLWQPLDLPVDDLAMLCAEAGRMVCVASGPTTGAGLLELDLASGRWQHRPVEPCVLPPEALSRPEPLWFQGHGDQPTHAWYYPPSGGSSPQAPLLVKSHSGPTGMARTGLNLAIQFWTSRGWGVVDVNYGGSTGFGRAYRERLDGQWGVVDVADCAAAALALVAAGRAAPQRIAIEGGSAGGFTTLAALCFTTVFRAGACRYGVADLAALATDTHRFEARYLDGLVGPWPQARALYEARSPLRHADRIGCPVIFFQGSQDRVVPPEQTLAMASALRANGVPVEVRLFEGEGHGFRDGAVQREVLEATEAFFRNAFGL